MKLSDLQEKKKGPIIGAPKGSQSDARLSPGTDDPSKYMRGGEWEAYREPQGINSNAGKIAGGTKKGTTRTKNKKTSEGISDQWNQMRTMHKEVRRFKRNPDAALVRGNGYLNLAIEMAHDNGDRELEDKLRDIRVDFSQYMHKGEYKNAISMWNHAESLRRDAINARLSESQDSLYEILNSGIAFWYNPRTDQVVSESDWTDPGSSHSQAATTDLGIPELEGVEKRGTDDYEVMAIAMGHGWIRGIQYDNKIVLQGDTQQHAIEAYEAIAPFIGVVPTNDGEPIQAVEVGSLDGFDHTFPVGSVQTEGTTKTKNKKTSESISLDEGIGEKIRSAISNIAIKLLTPSEYQNFVRDTDMSTKAGHNILNHMITMAREGENEKLADDLSHVRLSFARHMHSGEYKSALSMLHHASTLRAGYLNGSDHTNEGIQPGGAGVSGDASPGDRNPMTLSTISDTTKANQEKAPKLPGSEAPTKKVLKTIKKSLDDRPGNVSDINEAVDAILKEAVPRAMPRDYSADYELLDDKSEDVIGVARIQHGVIELLSVRNDLVEDYEGHIMSRLMSTIVRDADLADANLAIPLDDPSNLRQKRFLERFGFRSTDNGIMKRNAGSIQPPSVVSNHL